MTLVADRETKPVFINGDMFKGTFKRNNEGDYHCTEAEVRAMFRDQPRKTIDGKVLPNMELSELDQESIKSYKSIMESRRPGHVFLSCPFSSFRTTVCRQLFVDLCLMTINSRVPGLFPLFPPKFPPKLCFIAIQ